MWRSYTPVGQDNHDAAADDDDDDENIDDDEGSCLSLRDAEFLLDLLGEKSVVPSPYYWPENFLLGGGFDGFWES